MGPSRKFRAASVKEVTSEAIWQSFDPSVVVSSTGLATVVRFGRSFVQANYQNRVAGVTLTATPLDTFVIAGRVREPGESGVPDVRVLDTVFGSSTQTDINGQYTVAQLPRSQTRLRFEKANYEPVELDATPSNSEAAIQRIIRLTAGETVTPLRLAPNDLFNGASGEVVAHIPISEARELWMYVGRLLWPGANLGYVPFTVGTSLE